MKFFLNLILLTLVTTNLYATDISIENSRIRMMPPGVPMTAGYFLISNNTNKDIILTGVRSSSFKSIEMHNTIKDGDVMKMVKQESILISANSKLEFKPMSYHLMLIKPVKPISENEKIDVTFLTKSGDSISSVFIVKVRSVSFPLAEIF